MAGWRDDANCLGTDPEVFFQNNDGSSDIGTAKRVCGRCSVREPCLLAAVREEFHQEKIHIYGIRGGLSPGKRFKLIQEIKRRRRDAT